MLASARGLAEIIGERQTQIVTVPGLHGLLHRRRPRHRRCSISIFALVAVVGWVLLNRTTFGRRTLAVGGNPEAARLAGINVKRHTVCLYVLVGLCCGIAALMLVAPHHDRQLDPRQRSTSSTRSRRSSSAARCSPGAAARSSAPSSAS